MLNVPSIADVAGTWAVPILELDDIFIKNFPDTNKAGNGMKAKVRILREGERIVKC